MNHAKLSRTLNQLSLRPQDRRKRLIKVGRHLIEIRTVFRPFLQAQIDAEMAK